MKILAWIVLIALVLLAVFAAANWSLLATTASLDLLAATVDGPLGLILLGITLLFVGLFAAFALWLQTSALFETHRHVKQLEAQRELAERAEASRFISLGTQIEQEFTRLREVLVESRERTEIRIEGLDQSLNKTLNEISNSIAAHIGQVDDKLNRLAENGERRSNT